MQISGGFSIESDLIIDSHTAGFNPPYNSTCGLRGLESADLLDLWAWTEEGFLRRTEGSAIRRIGYERWQRNLAVALGNAPQNGAIIEVLQRDLPQASPLLTEHMLWALERHLMSVGV